MYILTAGSKTNILYLYAPVPPISAWKHSAIRRRLELIRYAEQNDCYIVEDDYDSEFRYEGPPVSTLYELCPERVIYLGSFSKLLAPALRLGYMIVPPRLLARCKYQKMYTDVHSDTLTQYTLAQFIENGYFERHIWKMKKYYARNRRILLKELETQFPGEFDILGHAAGLHLIVQFHTKRITKDIIHTIAKKGVQVYQTRHFYINKQKESDNKILLGYSHLSPDEITKGICIIREII